MAFNGVSMAAMLVATMSLWLGCASSTSSGGGTGTLDGAMAKWKSAGLHDYSYQFQRSCFCPEDYRRAVIITVRRDSIAGVVFADTRAAVPRENWERYSTVDGLFAIFFVVCIGFLEQIVKDDLE